MFLCKFRDLIQISISLIADEELKDDFSITVNTTGSSDDLNEEDNYLLVKRTQIPDFAIFYSLLGAKLRMLPVLVEIKPYVTA